MIYGGVENICLPTKPATIGAAWQPREVGKLTLERTELALLDLDRKIRWIGIRITTKTSSLQAPELTGDFGLARS